MSGFIPENTPLGFGFHAQTWSVTRSGCQLDVLRLMVAGRRNAEIADDLVLSTRTVDHHVSAILRKLGVRSRGDAAVAAVEGGLPDG
jgi:DNA-binding NarL/FixJ family response regulator